MDNAQLSDLIGVIYDCALEPERWSEVLARISRATQSAKAYIVFHDLENNVGGRFFNYGIEKHWSLTYFERFARLNPMPAVAMVRPVGEVVTLEELFEPGEWVSSVFYRGWIEPQALGDFLSLLAVRTGSRGGFLGFSRFVNMPHFADPDISLLKLLSPHICRSLRISDVLDLRTITSEALGNTLDAIAAGVFLLDHEGRVVYANAAAKDLIAAGTVVRLSGGRLSPTDHEANAVLRAALAGTAASRTDARSIALPNRAGAGLLATVLPLDQGCRRRILAPFAALHAVFVQDASSAPPPPMEAFATLHGLTKGEQRFLAVLMTGASVKEASAMLGVAEPTGRSHVQALLAKTGTRRQSDLVKLLTSSVPPVRQRETGNAGIGLMKSAGP